ncbi:MAG TPA: argininosuccinate lyase [Candidatus Dormibacteraeota bacterium]|jgi:argininosuccinate lyase|nr:argininosuccinate lyase [Candidatus Dormibacteraeota bacterium]
MPPSKLWGGRFRKGLLPELETFSSSLEVDYELYAFDVAGSIAHARGLHAAGLLNDAELEETERGLKLVRKELDQGNFAFLDSDEDIHTAVERRLTEISPEAGARLHAGRSRNDQVALDLRLYCRSAAAGLVAEIAAVVHILARRAAEMAGWPMPGYTHLQRAQPVTVGHHLLAHAQPLLRDADRARRAYDAADEMPLGSGALAGSTLPLERETVAEVLGFERLTQNSMDAVADRDFALDLVYACAVLGLHLSRLGEDVVLWSSAEFGFVRLADEISTGSSIMPQKKNPDIAELVRGRAGRSLGGLVALATVLKGLPLTYDRDLQEDKIALFSTVTNAQQSLEAVRLMVERLAFDRDRLAAALEDPDLYATDSAEQLVREGTPFRQAHREVGEQVVEGTHRAPWGAARSLELRDFAGAPSPDRVAGRATEVEELAGLLETWARSHPPSLP